MSARGDEKSLLERKLLSAAYYAMYAHWLREEAPAAALALETAARRALRQAEAMFALACRRGERRFTATDALAHAAQRELADFTDIFARGEQALLRRQRPEEARLAARLGQMARAQNQRFCALLDAADERPYETPQGFACACCGYALVAADAPPNCPVCGAGKGAFGTRQGG